MVRWWKIFQWLLSLRSRLEPILELCQNCHAVTIFPSYIDKNQPKVSQAKQICFESGIILCPIWCLTVRPHPWTLGAPSSQQLHKLSLLSLVAGSSILASLVLKSGTDIYRHCPMQEPSRLVCLDLAPLAAPFFVFIFYKSIFIILRSSLCYTLGMDALLHIRPSHTLLLTHSCKVSARVWASLVVLGDVVSWITKQLHCARLISSLSNSMLILL